MRNLGKHSASRNDALAQAAALRRPRASFVQAALGTGMAVVLMASSLAVSDRAYGATETAKDEVIYAKADASGDNEGIYVVNAFQGTSSTESDDAAYQSVTNLSTAEELVQRNGKVVFDTEANRVFYYQGDLKAETSLPWKVRTTYELDGKRISPEEAAGASGALTITLDIEPSDDAGLADYCNSYLVQAQGSFDPDTFSVERSDATMARSGSTELATCLVLPGESGSFAIEGTATEFSYGGWQISAMPLSLAIDLVDQDTSKLSQETQELENAASKLSGGSSSLHDGTIALDKGAARLAKGAATAEQGSLNLHDGANEVAEGADAMAEGVKSATSNLGKISQNSGGIMEGWSQIAKGIDNIGSGAQTLAAGSTNYQQAITDAKQKYAQGAQSLQSAAAAYQQAMAAAQTNPTAESFAALDAAAQAYVQCVQAAGAYGALDSADAGYTDLSSGIANLDNGAANLEAGASAFGEKLADYTSNVDTLSDSASSLNQAADDLSSGAASVAQGAGSLSRGLNDLSSGVEEVHGGTAELRAGASKLDDGLGTLAAEVQGMDRKILDGLQSAINKKLGGDFRPHSFVVPENTEVDQVQFVYMIEGIKAPEEPAEQEEAPESDQGILQRLLGLFGL